MNEHQRPPIKEKTDKEKLIDSVEKLIIYIPIWNQQTVQHIVSEIKINLEKIKGE